MFLDICYIIFVFIYYVFLRCVTSTPMLYPSIIDYILLTYIFPFIYVTLHKQSAIRSTLQERVTRMVAGIMLPYYNSKLS